MSEETSSGGLFDKAKSFLTDENVDKGADAAQKIAPDSVDEHIDTAAEQAKKYND
jgi:hypothetical protein